MGSDGAPCKPGKKIGVSLPPRRDTRSSLLMEEVSFATLADTAYVKLLHESPVMGMSDCDEGDDRDVMKPGSRAWSWLKLRPALPNGRDLKEVVHWGLAKSRSHNTWNWLQPPGKESFQFDPTKRWPQGW
uniref:Uncharacterized protein n=1 Tax=Physcomitrium patens TaxID=3218 RepID=A0A2K1JY23_PHYPA|nr:hypothetical protein PHYPA_013542 [Physcomitrium patens]